MQGLVQEGHFQALMTLVLLANIPTPVFLGADFPFWRAVVIRVASLQGLADMPAMLLVVSDKPEEEEIPEGTPVGDLMEAGEETSVEGPTMARKLPEALEGWSTEAMFWQSRPLTQP